MLVLGATSAVPTGDLRVNGEGCRPGERVILTIDGQSAGAATADQAGRFDTKLELPATIGRHVVGVECNDQRLERTVDLVVSTSGGAGNGGAASVAGLFAFFVVLLGLLRQGPVTTAERSSSQDE